MTEELLYKIENKFILSQKLIGTVDMCGYVHRRRNARILKFHIFLRDNSLDNNNRLITPDLVRVEEEINRFYSLQARDFRELYSAVEKYATEKDIELLSEGTVSEEFRQLMVNLLNEMRVNNIDIQTDSLSNLIDFQQNQNEDELVDPQELADLLSSQPVKNNYYDREGTLETITAKRWNEERSVSELVHAYLYYNRQKNKFFFYKNPPVTVGKRPNIKFPTFSPQTIIDISEDEVEEYYDNNFPTFRNREYMKTDKFRKEIWLEIRKSIRQFVYLREDLYDVVTAYIVLSYFYDVFNFVPYLDLWGQHGTGKSRLGNVINKLSYRSLNIVGASIAFMFRVSDALHGLWNIEESQGLLSDLAKKESRDLIKAGSEKNAQVGRIAGKNNDSTDTFQVFAPRVFQSTDLPDQIILDRCILLVMQKAPPNKYYKHPDTVIPIVNRLREYLMMLRLLKIQDFEYMIKNEATSHVSEFFNRDKNHAESMLGITKFFYPKGLDPMAKSLKTLLNRRNVSEDDVELQVLDHISVFGYALDEWILMANIVPNLNSVTFGQDRLSQQKNIKNSFDLKSLGLSMTKLGFERRRAHDGTEYFLDKSQIAKAYVRKGYDPTDLLGDELVFALFKKEDLENLEPTNLQVRTSGFQHTIEKMYSDDPEQLIYLDEQKTKDDLNDYFFEGGLTEAEQDLIEEELEKKNGNDE